MDAIARESSLIRGLATISIIDGYNSVRRVIEDMAYHLPSVSSPRTRCRVTMRLFGTNNAWSPGCRGDSRARTIVATV